MAVYARRAFCAVLLLRGLQRSRKAAQKFLPVDSSTSNGAGTQLFKEDIDFYNCDCDSRLSSSARLRSMG